MKTLQIMTGLLIVGATVGSAQMTLPTLPPRKGTIQEMWTQPAPPIAGSPFTLHVLMNHSLIFDRVETQTTLRMITVKLYWEDSPIGGSGSQRLVPLGPLEMGRYTVFVQSYFEGRFTDMEHLVLQVAQGAGPGPDSCIEEVYILPENPSTSDSVKLHVEGKWPTSGYELTASIISAINNQITVMMYWTSPTGQVLPVETPYHKTITLGPLLEGAAYVTVRCYLDNAPKATEVLTFQVEADDGGWWPWDGWPFEP